MDSPASAAPPPETSAKDWMPYPGGGWRARVVRVAWLPIPAFFVGILTLRTLDLSGPREIPLLLIVLNLVFTFLVSGFVAWLVARSFLKRSTLGLLMLGCGMVALAASGLAGIGAGLSKDPSGQQSANLTVTVHNLTVFLAALCHLAGAILARRSRNVLRLAGLWLAAGYSSVVVTSGLVILAAFQQWTPVFFVQGHGGTGFRQLVLAAAIALFGSTGIVLRTNRQERLSPFTYWYSLAVLLLAVGLFGVTVQTLFGGLVGWLGRAAQYLGGGYLLVAAIASVRETRVWEIPLEHALRREREFVSAILDTAGALIVVLDTEGRVVRFNRRCEDVTGYRSSEVVGRHVWDVLLTAEDARAIKQLYHKFQTGDFPRTYENAWVTRDGQRRHISWANTVLRNSSGQVEHVIATGIDVTERRQAEDALRDNALRLRQAHEILELVTKGAKVIIAAQDLDFNYMFFNEAYRDEIRRLTGKEIKLGDNMLAVLAHLPKEQAFAKAEWEQAMRGESTNKIVEFGDPGHRRRWYHVLHTPVRDAEGRLTGAGEVAYDVTEVVTAETALRESEERFHALAEALPQVVWTADAAGQVEWLNRRWYEYSGLDPVAGKGWSWWEYVSPEDLPRATERWREATRCASTFESETRLRRRDGEYRWFLVRAWPLKDAEGNVVRWFGTHTDVHDLKVAEAALRQSREDLDRAQAVGQIGSWRLDIGRNVLTWSDENHRIFGLPLGTELTYETFLGVVHPEDREYVDGKWKAGLAGEPYDIEHRIVADGTVKWVREKAHLEFDEAGRLLGGFGTTQHVSDRKWTEELLRRNEARFKLLSTTSGRLLATHDPQGLIEDVCREVMAHLGCQAFFNFLVEESAGRLRLNACAGISPEEFAGIEWLDYGVAICGCVARDGSPMVVEDVQNIVDERTALIKSFGIQAYCCHPLVVQGQVIGTLSFATRTRPAFTDDEIELMKTVTDQVAVAMQRLRSEQALRQANEQLELKVQERTGELAERASQLRALAGELTRSEQRERRRMAKLLHDHLQQLLVAAKLRAAILGRSAESAAQQSAEEIRGLLDNAIRASRSLTAELSPPILHDGGFPASLMWLARWMAETHGLSVDLSLEDGIPQPDEDVKILLFESVRELLFNAVKHAGARTAAVEVRRVEDSRLQIVVTNAGAGFDPSALKPAGSRGGGFGLFSIRERLALIGGRLEIASAPGEDSRFTMIVPVGETAWSQANVAEPAKPESPRGVSATPPSRRAEIHVVMADDHEVVRQGLAQVLEAEPDIVVVGEAADGMEAVELARRLAPDVVLMDLSMPGVNGIDATRMIREQHPQIQVIGLSMYEEPHKAQAMIDAGAAAYLSKSAPAEALIASIRTCVAAARLPA